MADAQAGGATGEPSVGHQQHILAQPGALDGAGDGQHLPHAGAALGALVADDDDIAVGDGAVLQRIERRSFTLENPRGALEHIGVEPGGLDHRALGRQRAVQDGDAAGRVDRVVHGAEHLAVRVRRFDMGQVLGHRLTGDSQAIPVQEACIQQCPHDHRHATDLVDVLHHVRAEGLHIGEVRDLVANPGEVRQGQLDTGLPGDGQQVQHRVGGTAERHHHGDGVLERFLGENVAGGDPAAQQLHDGFAGAAGVLVATLVDGDRRCAARQRHPQRFGGRGHGVGGVHTAAGALTGTDGALDDVHVLARHQPARARADRLEGVDDGDFPLAAVGHLRDTRHDRAVVEEDAGQVQPRRRHQHAGDRLVTTGQQHRAVEALCLHDGLDAVGDDLAGHQREVHTLVAHRDSVRHRDRAELQGIAAAGVDAGLDGLRQPLQGHVAGSDLVPRRADADLWLGPVVITHADGAQHAAGRGFLQAVGDIATARLDVDIGRGGKRI
ncbi:MAG: hypothetical protein K2Y33_12020 [Mycolicibacterium frederiksbergense]|nr:hypothetical protein [Mycolicibacterium frederiksbergense]